MGLTHRSVGTHAAAFGGTRRTGERIVALAGNPNVGKSTVFNALTGMRQHTGNWAGKTVGCACGRCRSAREQYLFVDLPGTYSLQPHSAEEAVACDFVRGGKADAVVVVCDATCLERTLVLALQMHSVTPNTIVCVNLLDEARHKRIRIDLPALQAQLGMPVVGVTARKKKTLRACSTRSTPLWQCRSRARTVRRRPETRRTMCAAQRSSAMQPSGGRRRNMPRVTGGSTACSRAARPATPSCCWGWRPCCG